jgi:hypothetical protein
MIPIIRQARDKDAQAAGHIERALSLGSGTKLPKELFGAFHECGSCMGHALFTRPGGPQAFDATFFFARTFDAEPGRASAIAWRGW